MSRPSHGRLWRKYSNFTTQEKTGQSDRPAKGSDLVPEKLVGGCGQRSNIIAVDCRKATKWRAGVSRGALVRQKVG